MLKKLKRNIYQRFQIPMAPRMFSAWDFVVGIFTWKVLPNMGWVLLFLNCQYICNKKTNKLMQFQQKYIHFGIISTKNQRFNYFCVLIRPFIFTLFIKWDDPYNKIMPFSELFRITVIYINEFLCLVNLFKKYKKELSILRFCLIFESIYGDFWWWICYFIINWT